jgi:hypothetical protein
VSNGGWMLNGVRDYQIFVTFCCPFVYLPPHPLEFTVPQDIHAQIGESCAKSYIKCRSSNDADIMNIMTRVADDLSADWFDKYDAEAFVGPWDIANYVSDYLVQQSGNESCECSANIH